MLTALQLENFRVLAQNRITLRPLQILIGENGAGKTTLLHALRFLGQSHQDGVLSPLRRMTPSFYDLLFDRERPLRFAAEVTLPIRGADQRLRYELELGVHPERRSVGVLRENLFLRPTGLLADAAGCQSGTLAQTTMTDDPPADWTRLLRRNEDGEVRLLDLEGGVTALRLKPERTALGRAEEDPNPDRFDAAMAVLRFLRDGVQYFALVPDKLREPAVPGDGEELFSDGGNLPAVVQRLQRQDPQAADGFRRHVAQAIRGLAAIDVVEQPENKKLVLRARFDGQHDTPVPSYLLSEGTLRVMALSLLAFVAPVDRRVLYLIEEVENGLHPRALQTVFEALDSPNDALQVMCSTHSPLLLGHARLDQLLLFRRGDDGAARIDHGDDNAELRDFAQRVSLVDLFARGVLS